MNALQRNLNILEDIQERSGAKILLALKGFSTTPTFNMISNSLKGICASSLHEAKLGKEFFKGEIHSYSPAYKDNEINTIIDVSDTIIFNSINQWSKYKDLLRDGKKFGIRINPEHSEAGIAIYDPCSPDSRLGIKSYNIDQLDWKNLSGIHMHNLCQNGVQSLERTLEVVEKKCKDLLHHIDWFNVGGGHHLTHPDYDVDRLVILIKKFQEKYNLQMILEPGEAVVFQTGILMTRVLDIIPGNIENAILDFSVPCHTPDVIEMPYRPEIEFAAQKDILSYNYILGGVSCLAGDTLGFYSFSEPLEVGQIIELKDMSQYTMVKSTTFNGIPLPSVVLVSDNGEKQEVVQSFGYDDFKSRLV